LTDLLYLKQLYKIVSGIILFYLS